MTDGQTPRPDGRAESAPQAGSEHAGDAGRERTTQTGPGGTARPDLICSARKCRAAAEYALAWRNPRIHAESRRKIWLACEEHGGFLHEYLASRGFPVEAMPIDELDDDAEAPVGQ